MKNKTGAEDAHALPESPYVAWPKIDRMRELV
jgi:hypothetical protein